MFTLGSFMYERHEDNLNTVRDGLLRLSEHDYKPSDPGQLSRQRSRCSIDYMRVSRM
uniref:Uncharacterized protein n=1 Tax=Brassica campestris TaxID=3711 RepID=A0A3P5YXC0_BRACM|nr:unnamed protein product [Brassica rapa]